MLFPSSSLIELDRISPQVYQSYLQAVEMFCFERSANIKWELGDNYKCNIFHCSL